LEYVSIFNGQIGAMLKYDPAKPGQPHVLQDFRPAPTPAPRMTYLERGGKMAPAILQKIEFNPVLSEDRFKILAVAT
jgi:hypothetical protein